MVSLLPPSNLSDAEEPAGNTQASQIAENEENCNTMSRGVVRNRAMGRDLRQALKANLEKFQIDIWAQEGMNQRGSFFGPELILPDKVITTLIQKARSICDPESLMKALERDNIDIRFAVIGPHAHKLIEVILSSLVELPIEEENRAPPNPVFTNAALAELRSLSCSTLPPSINGASTNRQTAQIRTRGRPPAALRAEEAHLEREIAQVAQARMAEAVASGEDGTRWDLSLLGKRPRGRPTAEMQEARRQAEAAKAEIKESLVTEAAFPLLWARKLNSIQPL